MIRGAASTFNALIVSRGDREKLAVSMFTLFDVSELGPCAQTGNGGIRRAIEQVGSGLLARSDLDVGFVGLSFPKARAYAFPLAQDAGPERFNSGGGELLERLAETAGRGAAKIFAGRTRVLRATQRLLEPLRAASMRRSLRVPPSLLKRADVYHSPFRPLPRRSSANRKVAFFITIYDLIPITHPSFAGDFFCNAARSILASITPGTWILCISQFAKDQVCEFLNFPPEQVFVTPLAASAETFHPCDGRCVADVRQRYAIGSGPYLLSVGANDARKNIPHLLECFGRLLRNGELRDLRLVLVGAQHNLPAVEAVLARYPELAASVLFTGYVPNEDLSAIYSGAVAFAFPSLVEGFGLPPLEAMQCGLPVICSNAASLPEVMGQAGFLLPPTDHDAWCNAILQLVRDERLRQDLSRKSIERAAQFSWEATIDATVRAYKLAVGATADCRAAAIPGAGRILQKEAL